MKDNALDRFLIQPKGGDEVPGDGFAFTVLVGCEVYTGLFLDFFFERADGFFLGLGDFILGFKTFIRVKPKFFWGRSRMCPMEASTLYSLPRNF